MAEMSKQNIKLSASAKENSCYLSRLFNRLAIISCMSVISISAMFLTGCEKDEYEFIDYSTYFQDNGVEFFDNKLMDEAIALCDKSDNKGKSIGVFGGSISKRSESGITKMLWAKYLNMDVTTYGIGGNGYATSENIMQQVDKAGVKDIYILWSSTNDFWKNTPPGEPTDYSASDNYDADKLTTQCGAINYCIRKLRQINPESKIYMFLSIPFFSNESGHVKDSKKGNKYCNFYHYVELQRQCAEINGIKYLNQFDIPTVSEENVDIFYHDDKVHLTNSGYAAVSPYQLFFLASETDPLSTN